jgi:hypothetical protein
MLTIQIDTDFSSTYLEQQINIYKQILDNLLDTKKKQEVEEEEEEIKQLRKCKIKTKKIKYDEPLILPDIDDEVEEPALPVEEKKEEIKPKPEPAEKITCGCGTEYAKKNKKRHEGSKFHQEYLKLSNIK